MKFCWIHFYLNKCIIKTRLSTIFVSDNLVLYSCLCRTLIGVRLMDCGTNYCRSGLSGYYSIPFLDRERGEWAGMEVVVLEGWWWKIGN